MLRAPALAIALSLALAARVSAQEVPRFEVAAASVGEEAFPVAEVSFPNGARGLPGVAYTQPLGHRPLTLDLYLPPDSVQPPEAGFPLVVYIHGGGWMSGTPRLNGPFVNFPEVLAWLSAQGYVVAAVQYRLGGEAPFPAPAQDVKAALRWLRARASELGMDPARAVAWGISSGGHLAALTALSCGTEELAPEPGVGEAVPAGAGSDCVQGAISWYGIFDMTTIAEQAREAGALSRAERDAPEWQLLGCFARQCRRQQLAAASPITYVDEDDPPLLLVVGTGDRTVPYQQTLEMADALEAAGVHHYLMVLPGMDHGFQGQNRDQTRNANLQALDATFRFIQETLEGGS